MKWTTLLVVFAVMTLGFAALAFAADDDTADDDTADDDTADDDTADDDAADDDATDDDTTGGDFSATVDFSNPVVLQPNVQYDFEFQVTNTTTASATQQWIDLVDLYMPSENYLIDSDNISSPDDLHGGEWTAETIQGDTGDVGIRWAFTSGITSEAYGDVHEGESQLFAFRATTDADATDGFDFKVESDSGLFVEGTACIVDGCDETGDDDDIGGGDDDDDDDDAAGDDDDDDDDDSGCGC